MSAFSRENLPTEPGLYMQRENPEAETKVLRVVIHHGRPSCWFGGACFTVRDIGGEWGPRIPSAEWLAGMVAASTAKCDCDFPSSDVGPLEFEP